MCHIRIRHFSRRKLTRAGSIRVWLSKRSNKKVASSARLIMKAKFTRKFVYESENKKESKQTTHVVREGESFIFVLYAARRLVCYFSGWKFSSSSLLKILLGFRLKLFLCNGNFHPKCLACLSVGGRKATISLVTVVKFRRLELMTAWKLSLRLKKWLTTLSTKPRGAGFSEIEFGFLSKLKWSRHVCRHANRQARNLMTV